MVATRTPSWNTRYPVTATLSVAAVHDKARLVSNTFEADTELPPGHTGAVVSVVVAVVCGPVVDQLPAASPASTLKV